MSRLAGRVAVVTGAASGIGRAIAARFAAEGAAVLVVDVAPAGDDVAAGIRARGGRADSLRADVTREDDVQAMVDTAVARLGGLDILVNNAGVGRFVPFDRLDPGEWDRIVGVNLRAVYLGCRAALPALRAGGRGVILNLSSQSGLQAQAMNQPYCASKAGVILLTRSLARELGPEGIRVNCICPGGTETPLLRAFSRSISSAESTPPRPPLGRFAQPSEIAAAALFLVSDEASYVTGVALPVDGGATA